MYEEIVPQPKEESDQYPLPILRLYQCQRTGMFMPSDWDDYTLDIKLLKHYQIIIGVLIWMAYHISVLA